MKNNDESGWGIFDSLPRTFWCDCVFIGLIRFSPPGRYLDGNAITSVPSLGVIQTGLRMLFVSFRVHERIDDVIQIAVQQSHHECGWQRVRRCGLLPKHVCSIWPQADNLLFYFSFAFAFVRIFCRSDLSNNKLTQVPNVQNATNLQALYVGHFHLFMIIPLIESSSLCSLTYMLPHRRYYFTSHRKSNSFSTGWLDRSTPFY
jgi:hypothetical protein